MQNPNAIRNPNTILTQSRNLTTIGEHTAREYRSRVYVGPYVFRLHQNPRFAPRMQSNVFQPGTSSHPRTNRIVEFSQSECNPFGTQGEEMEPRDT